MQKKTGRIEIVKMEEGRLLAKIRGTAALIVSRLGHKVGKDLMAQGSKDVKKPKGPRNPQKSFIDAFYLIDPKEPNRRYELTDNEALYKTRRKKYAFPANCIKNAMVGICQKKFVQGLNGQQAKILIRVHGNYGDLIELKGSTPEMREDITRLNTIGRPPDLRFRPQFDEWEMEFEITYNADMLSMQAVVNLLSLAGEWGGIGERRPEREGNNYGTFEVVKVTQMKSKGSNAA